jgi:hypothetical protein
VPELLLSAQEARRLTDEVKADAQRLWIKLLKLYDNRAHIMLGYSSWAAYCEHEFQMSQGRAYQLLRAARVIECTTVHSLQVTSQVPESERLARELVPLLNDRRALDEAWNEAVQCAGGNVPTAEEVRAVVSRKLSPLPAKDVRRVLHDLEGVDPSLFKLATRAIGLVNLLGKFVTTVKPEDVWAGLKDYEKPAFLRDCLFIVEWIDFINHLKEKDSHGLILSKRLEQ